jgi:hypothetical protein
MMPYQPLKAQKEFYRRRQHTLYWLLIYKNIMNALAASIKKERPT